MRKLESNTWSIIGASTLALTLANPVLHTRFEDEAEVRRPTTLTVTSPRRESKIQKVPVVVAALYRQKLEHAGTGNQPEPKMFRSSGA